MPPAFTATAVPALVPLSLLEAMRNLDTPLDDGLPEPVGDMLNKRLGLSDTVAAQISRYRAVTDERGTLPRDEALSVVRLAGRRPDVVLLFADAGRRAARHAVRTAPAVALRLVDALPGPAGRRAASRLAQQLARDIFECELRPSGIEWQVRAAGTLVTAALPDGSGCSFHTAGLAELLRKLVGFEGAMLPERCVADGGSECRWRGVPPSALCA
ncbi:MAG: hypothetical protein NW201_12410 [Gemmatimonadales bacterium]|nr:hypothetical protein [Gemmatimonadales bacterium]